MQVMPSRLRNYTTATLGTHPAALLWACIPMLAASLAGQLRLVDLRSESQAGRCTGRAIASIGHDTFALRAKNHMAEVALVLW